MTRSLVSVFWIVSLALLAIRLVFAATTMVVDDEAYYLAYARHLDWGYIDHGPVIGVLIRISTLIFGENGFGIRFVGIALITVMSAVLYWFGRTRFSPITGITLSLTVSANMLMHVNSVIVTPDAPMMFFTVLAILVYYLAFFENRRHFWLAGFLLGLAILSKISAVFPALAIFLFPWVSRKHRDALRDARFYLSFGVAFLVVLPFIVWNLQNDLAFFRYQGSHVARGGGLQTFIELWAGLFVLTGPVFFVYAAVIPFVTLIKTRFRPDQAWQLFFGLAAFVPLVYFGFHSLFSRFELNWPAPAFCGGIFLFGIAMGEAWDRRRRLFKWQVGFSLFLIAVVTVQIYYPLLPLEGKNDPTNRYYEYTAFKAPLKNVLDNPDVSGLRVVANNYQIPSMVNLYQRPDREAICLSIGYHETLYSFLYNDDTLVGEDFVFVTEGRSFPERLIGHFAAHTVLDTVESLRGDDTVLRFSLWRVEDYRGRGSTGTHGR